MPSNDTVDVKLSTGTCRYCQGEGIYRGLKKVEDPCTYCEGRGWILLADSNYGTPELGYKGG